MELSKEKVSQ